MAKGRYEYRKYQGEDGLTCGAGGLGWRASGTSAALLQWPYEAGLEDESSSPKLLYRLD